jgi:hypothetical protein
MDTMKDAQASGADAPASQAPASPPRQKPSTLASIAIQSFATFRSQTSSQPVPIAVPVQSPVRRKPLPADSPIAARFSQSSLRSNSITSRDTPAGSVLSPPLTDEGLFAPRDLDR